MKRISLCLVFCIALITAFAQFDGGGTFIGWQLSRTSLKSSYYFYSGDSAKADNVTIYKDRFWFNYLDFKYGNYSENRVIELDASGIIMSLVYCGYLIAEKEENWWKKNGRLKKIKDNLGENFTGKGYDWSYMTVDMAWGNGVVYGFRWDIGILGTYDISNGAAMPEKFEEGKLYKGCVYNSLGLGVHKVVEEAIVGSVRLDWLRAGKRNGFEIYPEIKVNVANFIYGSLYYKFRYFGEFDGYEEVPYRPKMSSNCLGLRLGFWIGDW